jgi:hypothetical protein
MDVRAAGIAGLTLVVLGLGTGPAAGATYHAAAVAGDGSVSGGDCTASSPCWPDEALEAAVASNDGPDTVRLAAGTYAGPSGSVSIDQWPATSDPITVVGAGAAETILAGSGVADNVEAVVRLGSTTDETAPGRLTLRDLTVSIVAAADPDTSAIVSRVQRLALDHVRVRMAKIGATDGRHGIWSRRADSELVLDHADVRPTESSYQPDTGNGVFALGPLTVRDSRVQVDNLGSSGRVVPIHARNDFVLQRSRLEGGTLGLRFQQDFGSPPLSGLVDSSTLRGAAVGILFVPDGSASLALRNSEVQSAYSLLQRLSIATTGGFGSGAVTVDSSILNDPTALGGMPMTCTYSRVSEEESRCPDGSNLRGNASGIDRGNPAPLTAQESSTDLEGAPRVAACLGTTARRDIGPIELAGVSPCLSTTPPPGPGPGGAGAAVTPGGGAAAGPAGSGSPPPVVASAPRLLNLDLAAARFRARTGTRVWFTLSRAARIEVLVYRVAGRRRISVARLSLAGAAGGNDLALRLRRVKRLKRGAHRIAFTPVSADGVRGATRLVKVTLR